MQKVHLDLAQLMGFRAVRKAMAEGRLGAQGGSKLGRKGGGKWGRKGGGRWPR